MGKRLSLVIPAHNEGRRIAKTIENYLRFLEAKKKEKVIDEFHIIVVANNCRDNTVEVTKKASGGSRNVTILNFKNGGKGFAIKEGFKYSLDLNDNLVGFVDADMATSAESYFDLVEKIGNYDGIIASRYVKGAIINPKQSFIRTIVSRLGNFIIRSMFMINTRDTQCGAKLFTRNAVETILPKLEMTQWAFDIDILYNIRKTGLKVKEIPTIWSEPGGSHLNIKKSSIQVLLAIIQLRMLNSAMKRMWKIISPTAGFLYKSIK